MTTATQTTTSTEANPGTAFEPLAVNPDGIPERLKERPQWLVWKLEKRDGELTKVPYSPSSLTRASSTDLMTWATFEGAIIVYQKHRFDGIGFVFCSGAPFCGIDLDKCRNPETGDLKPWAKRIIKSFGGAYIEASPSGTGVHIITRGDCPSKNTKHAEMYDMKRYFTITGVRV